MKKNFLFPLLLAVLAAFSAGVLRSQTAAPVTSPPHALKLGAGFDYSRGDYGFAQTTEVFSVPVNLIYEQDRWVVRATLPFLSVKGPASVIEGGGPVVTAPGRPVTKYQSGLGDAMLSATYHAHPVPGELNVDLTGRVKFPTANEDRGLGTGETDYYAQLDLYRSFDALTPFVSLGYRFLGESTLYPLKDGAYFSAGGSYRVAPTTAVGVAYDWRSRIIAGAPNASDALVFVSTNPNDRWNVLGYLLAGFNDASPDVGLGGSITYKF